MSLSLQIKVCNYRHVYLILDGTRCNHINIENSECIYILKKYIFDTLKNDKYTLLRGIINSSRDCECILFVDDTNIFYTERDVFDRAN